eukprot:4781193-Pleurochrysis_carterae.AAC.3
MNLNPEKTSLSTWCEKSADLQNLKRCWLPLFPPVPAAVMKLAHCLLCPLLWFRSNAAGQRRLGLQLLGFNDKIAEQAQRHHERGAV